MSVKVSVTVTEGPNAGLTHEFTEGFISVGRGKASLVLNDKKVSGVHCNFIIEDGDVFIEDLNSTNGTFIGGKRIVGRRLLQNLDEIIIGLSKISVAIIDQISEFKAKNIPSVKAAAPTISAPIEDDDDESIEVLTPLEDLIDMDSKSGSLSQTQEELSVRDSIVSSSVSKSKALAEPEAELPAPDAVYRETGIRRIEDMISDEMDSFSKWDHPAVGDSTGTGRIAGVVPKIKVTLTLRRSPEGGTNAVCTKSVTTLGRKDVDIRLNDLDCSRKHAAVEIVGGQKVFARDLASTNGTYVNGKRIAYQEMKTGDLLQIGQTIFEISVESA